MRIQLRAGAARLPRWREIAEAAGFALVWFGGMHLAHTSGWRPLDGRVYELAGAATAGALLLRRSAPCTVFVAVAVVYPFAVPDHVVTRLPLISLPVMVAAYAVTAAGRLRPAFALLVCEVAVVQLWQPWTAWPTVLSLPHGVRDGLWGLYTVLASAALTTAVVVLLGNAVHQQARSAEELRSHDAELQRLRLVEAETRAWAERTLIARELHDVIAHHVSAIVIRAQAAERVADRQPEEPREAARWIAASGQQALAGMRQIVRLLRPDRPTGDLDPTATLEALPDMVSRLQAVGLHVAVRIQEPTPDLPAAVELTAVRIIQEALTNALVHAAARRALVELDIDNGVLTVCVDDSGDLGAGRPATRSGPITDGSGNGIRGMQERAALCGGTLDIGASPLGGWRVSARLPVPRTDLAQTVTASGV